MNSSNKSISQYYTLTTDFASEIASFLLKINALQLGIFKLHSGKESPYYIDLRILQSFPRYFKLVIHKLKEIITNSSSRDFHTLASVPTSGLVFSAALAYELEKPHIYVRTESKSHGTNKLVKGYLQSGSEVLLLDDVVTTGISISKAADIIRANGGIIHDVVAIVNREEGAEAMLNRMNINLTSVLTITQIVKVLHLKGLVNNNTMDSLLTHRLDGGLESD